MMNRPALALSVALVASTALAAMYARDVQRERGRADALAARLSELEPLERSGSIVVPTSDERAPRLIEPAIETSGARPVRADTPTRPNAVMEYQGTLRTRRLVERLQSALATRTPLQDYQIQPLISAIDAARSDIEQQGGQHVVRREENRRIVQAVGDILFESQLETLIAILDSEHDARR